MKDVTTTKTALLHLAQELAQRRGLNAFSFRDLARGVGITTAGVHHHFASKADLARELMVRYRLSFGAELEAINMKTRSHRRKLEMLADLFCQTLQDGNRLCLCGMFAAEYPTLPEIVQQEVRAFYDETEAWLREVLEDGRKCGVFHLRQPSGAVAKTFLATLEGAMIAARAFDDERRLTRAAKWLVATVEVDDLPGAA